MHDQTHHEGSIQLDKSRICKTEQDGGVRVPAVAGSEKLRDLLFIGMTSFEIAVATGCSVRAVEVRRRKLKEESITTNVVRNTKFDVGLDNLYSLVSMMRRSFVEVENIRAWLVGRSAYLEEQRPASLLRAGEFDLVREAAKAYAASETPQEFLAGREDIPRVEDLIDV